MTGSGKNTDKESICLHYLPNLAYRIIEPIVNYVKMRLNDAEFLAKTGIVGLQLYRIEESNTGMALYNFESLENAKKHQATLESPDIQAGLERLGVVLPLKLWIAEDIQL